MHEEKKDQKRLAITRREFMQYSAAAGVALAVPGLFAGCSDSNDAASSGTDSRTYYFDLSDSNPGHEFFLRAGSIYQKLKPVDSNTLRLARQGNSFLNRVPDQNITHYAPSLPVPRDSIVLCWIVGKDPSDPNGTWDMSLLFYHIPINALEAASLRPGADPTPGANKLRLYGIDSGGLSASPDAFVQVDDFKNWQDQATGMVFGHQELICGQAESAAHIQQNIISPQPTTYELSAVLQEQGPATESGGWATLEVYINPDTGKPYLNSQGQKQCNPKWSDHSLNMTGQAILPPLQQAKNDTTLGANVTNLPVDQINSEMDGKIWKVMDGVTTVDAGSFGDGGPDYSFQDKSREHGYLAKLSSASDQNISIDVTNWFFRYLGIYVRFLDANGNPIKVSDLPSDTTDSFPQWAKQFNTDYDNMALLVESTWEFLGIPIAKRQDSFSFVMPEMASSAQVLAAGLGHGHNAYPKTGTAAGCVTAVLNLVIPTLFLAQGAASSYASFAQKFSETSELVKLIEDTVVLGGMDGFIAGGFDDPEALIDIVKPLGEYLLSKGGTWLMSRVSQALAKSAVSDIPTIGGVANAIAAAGMAAEIVETVAEVANSPRTYVRKLTVTHDILVTVYHDPKDPDGFPAVADYYELTALFDDGTPTTSGKILMPGTTTTKPRTYTFSGVPYGGKVNISVGFYSDDGWLAGKGSTGSVDNTMASAEITITEIKVPLTPDTYYTHKEKTALDDSGNLIWKASDVPPETLANLNCGNLNGDLCQPACITVSEHFASAGYTWKSYSTDVTSCESGGAGQLFQFANMGTAQSPQASHLTSGCGFSNLVRVAYDLMSSQNNNFYLDSTGEQHLLRQIRLNLYEKPDFDGPESNRCWGGFNLPSDAFLLHPAGKAVSINAEFNKIEVLDLPDAATADNDAPIAQAYSAQGLREGLIDGPVAAAISPKGVILILESKNMRIQAFDLGGNPARHFGAEKDQYHTPLKAETDPVMYLDMAVEYTGYLYVLSYVTQQGLYEYRLDIYTPQGDWLCRTTDVNAARLTVDFWRNAYTLNYETLKYPDGSLPTVTEPSVSQWIPSTP